MSLFLVIGFGEKRSDPKLLYVGKEGPKARSVLDQAGVKDKKVCEAHLFVNPERSKRRMFLDNESSETKAERAGANLSGTPSPTAPVAATPPTPAK